MRDDRLRRAIKAPLRWLFLNDLRLKRRLRLTGAPRHELAGSCNGCGKCCEEPSMSVGFWLAHLTPLRVLFLLWQRHVNGFVFARFERRHRVLVFTCSHFDAVTRQCDSYESRPAFCHDYPMRLLDEPWPILFDECSYTLRLRDGAPLSSGIDALDLPEGERAALKKKLRLE